MTTSSRQLFVRSKEQRAEGVREVDRATYALILALPASTLAAVKPWLDNCVRHLLDVRLVQQEREDVDSDLSTGLLAIWTSTNLSLGSRLSVGEIDTDGLRTSMTRADERMRTALRQADPNREADDPD